MVDQRGNQTVIGHQRAVPKRPSSMMRMSDIVGTLYWCARRRAQLIGCLKSLKLAIALPALLVAATGTAATAASVGPDHRHSAMVQAILRAVQEDYPGLINEPLFKAVIDAIGHIDRSEFVPTEQRAYANQDRPLPIGFDQTISRPYIVAVMTAAIEARAGSNILEVGTGSGYQAAVLSRLGANIHSIEILPQLASAAAERLHRLRYENIRIKAGDGFAGWPEFAPYDGIIVTAGAADVPSPLLDQLKPGGKLVMPVGANTMVEQLIVLTKQFDGSFLKCSLGPAMFVPLTGVGRTAEIPALYDRKVPLCRMRQTARWPGQPIG
jgi:protein-L-isoaspartate(D-aspartate) O-methyltransferase